MRWRLQEHNTTVKSCEALDGAICATHARVQQRAQSEVQGRRLVSQSDVLLNVDCSASGGASYASTSEWSMEEAGPTRSAGCGRMVSVALAFLVAAVA
eukprot:Skav228525  [mRNA]  locus=scaffold796:152127:154472:+ [translate_table: standard]